MLSVVDFKRRLFPQTQFLYSHYQLLVSFLKNLVHVVFLVELEGFSLKFVLQPLE